MNKTSLTGYETLIFQVHSYFEKGCGKSARDNPERYYGWFWIHCFSKEFERMTGDAMDVCLRVVKESSKSRFDSLSVRNSVLIISHITFRDCRLHIFSDNRSRNSCILCQDHGQSFLTIWTSRTFLTTKRGNIHQLRQYDYSFLVNSMKEQCQIAFGFRNELLGDWTRRISYSSFLLQTL